MAEQTLKYGLTTALRAFTLPESWHCAEQLVVVNAQEIHKKHTFTQNEFLGTQHNGEQKHFIIPENFRGEVQLKHYVSGECAGHCTLHIGKNAHVKVLDEITGSGTYAKNMQITIEAGAAVEYCLLQDMTIDSTALLNYEAHITNASLHWFFCGVGADTTQANIATHAGNNVTVVNNAVIFGNGKQQFDVHVATNHQGTNTRSDMLTRSVLDDRARAVYHGLIHIGAESPECDSYQKDEVILLSDAAGADAIPNLEIQNSKVRCSHGATIGRIDEEKLFYFRSRGIDKEAAKKMITQGFLEPLFIAPWQEKIYQKIN